MNKFLKSWKKITNKFCTIFLHKKNVQRCIPITLISFVLAISMIVGIAYASQMEQKKAQDHLTVAGYLFGSQILSEEDIYKEVQSIQSTIDKSTWKKYQSSWYGFKVEYPQDWITPVAIAGTTDSMWEYRYKFRREMHEASGIDPYVGFDVVIYDVDTVKELKFIEEFPVAKNMSQDDGVDSCEKIDGHIIETGDYPAEEIYIPPTDDCYNTSLFFSFIEGAYIYVIVPIVQEDYVSLGDPRVEVSDNFPEFYAVVSTLNSIDIVRPDPAILAAKKATPYPVSYKVVAGRLVCAKENDKPSKSKKGKGKHLDMECCLDPDEYPNPHCYYDPQKYGEYL